LKRKANLVVNMFQLKLPKIEIMNIQ